MSTKQLKKTELRDIILMWQEQHHLDVSIGEVRGYYEKHFSLVSFPPTEISTWRNNAQHWRAQKTTNQLAELERRYGPI